MWLPFLYLQTSLGLDGQGVVTATQGTPGSITSSGLHISAKNQEKLTTFVSVEGEIRVCS